jgi:cobyrinic acid a,c-diamide synthase
MGRRDGAAPATPLAGSAAALAAALGIPAILALDVSRMGQGAAAIAHGLATFPGAPPLAGVILNRTGSARHADLVRRAVETVAPVLGILPRRDDLALPARHLGLVQAAEHPELSAFLDCAADAVESGCDLDAIAAAAAALAASEGPPARLPPLSRRIAVARDAAFGFAYHHMLGDWRAAGAEILPFSPLADEPPDAAADAVFLPGGYPELHAGRIAAARAFRAGMHAAAARGAAIYGECGGFMVLGDGLVDADGTRHAMLGLLRLETSFARPRRVLGYRRLAPLGGPWAELSTAPLAAHEFHYAVTLRAEGPPLFAAEDAAGRDLGQMGLVAGRVAGSFAHIIEPTAA